jgi:hypothetical protein
MAGALLLGGFRLVSWPRPVWETVFLIVLPVPEILILLGSGILLRGYSRVRLSYPVRFVALLFAVYLGILIIWNAGEVIYRWNYRDHFVLSDDFSLLPGLLAMLTKWNGFRTAAGSVLSYLLALSIPAGFGWLMVRFIHIPLGITGENSVPRTRRVLGPGLAVILAGLLQAAVFPQETPTLLLLKGLITEQAAPKEVKAVPAPVPVSPENQAAADEAFRRAEDRSGPAFPGIGDGDIHLLVVESYGHTLFSNPVHRENIRPVYGEMTDRLAESGWFSVSGFLDSPAYGGRSWLADATLLTGRRMVNQRTFDAHIYDTGRNVPGLMAAAGYHTVYAAPGTRDTPEDWKAYYGFDEYIIEGDYGWKGPFISFGEMSDQYLLNHVGRQFKDSGTPVFLTALMVSSHVPFVLIPEYIDDWDRLGDGSIYRKEGIRQFDNNWLSGSEYPEGYVFSIDYVLKTISGYIDRFVDPNSLVIIVGDHQPRIPISENTATSGVPVHFLSRSPERLESLESLGFSKGFRPADDGTILPMEDFPELLVSVLRPSGYLSQYLGGGAD